MARRGRSKPITQFDGDDQDAFDELFQYLTSGADEPIAAIVFSFAWLERVRVKRRWHLFDNGLVVIDRHLFGGQLSEEVADYLDQVKSAARDAPKALPVPGVKTKARPRFRTLYDATDEDVRSRARVLRKLFDAGEVPRPFPVISVRGSRGNVITTVWGIGGKATQWPSRAKVRTHQQAFARARTTRG
jgi:hypothetical protein